MTADCSSVGARTAALLEEAVPDAEREALRGHLDRCAACRAALDTERRARDAVRAAAPSLDPGWTPLRPKSAPSRRPLLLLAPAAVLVLFGAVLLVILRPGPKPSTDAAPAQEAPPPAVDLDRLIAELGDDRVDRRDAAQRGLEAMGEKAEPRLREALASPDLRADSETAGRIRDTLARIERSRVGRLAYVRMGATNTSVAAGGALVLCDWDGTNAVELAPEGRGAHAMPVWSPDGRWIGFTERGARGPAADGTSTACVADARGKNFRRVAPGLLVGWAAPDRLIVERGKKTYVSADLSNGREEAFAAERLPGRPTPETAAALRSKGWTETDPCELSPDGAQVAFVAAVAAGPGERIWSLKLLEIVSGEVREIATGMRYDPRFSFSPDGKRLIVVKDKFSRQPVQVAVSTLEEKPLGGPMEPTYTGTMFPSFSRDGSKAAFVSTRGGGYELWIAGTGDGTAKALSKVGGFMGRPYAWQPSGPPR